MRFYQLLFAAKLYESFFVVFLLNEQKNETIRQEIKHDSLSFVRQCSRKIIHADSTWVYICVLCTMIICAQNRPDTF